jgi:predicted phosphodiesterase
MKILCISDTHTKHNLIPTRLIDNADGTIDTIIHAGDISSGGYKGEILKFLEWYNKLPYKNKILIAGNHDFYMEEGKPEDITAMLAEFPNIIYLNDSGIEIDGIKFWGSPVQPYFYNWAFNRIGDAICKHWELIPLDTQVLITHGPVKGILDNTKRNGKVGCPYLLEKLTQLIELKLHVCGHIHEAYGRMENEKGQIFVNASVLNVNYYMANEPIQVEI